jgi:hypothetical protein
MLCAGIIVIDMSAASAPSIRRFDRSRDKTYSRHHSRKRWLSKTQPQSSHWKQVMTEAHSSGGRARGSLSKKAAAGRGDRAAATTSIPLAFSSFD